MRNLEMLAKGRGSRGDGGLLIITFWYKCYFNFYYMHVLLGLKRTPRRISEGIISL